jgi:Iap family predicted aminopeptidase
MSALDGKTILSTIERICSFGTRWMGGEGAEKTRQYVMKEFERTGLTVELQPFFYPHYQPLGAGFSVEGCALACEPIALSGSNATPIEGQLVYGGTCSRDELTALRDKGIDLAGTIVLSDNLRSFVAYPEVEAAGAAGFVSMTNLPENTIRCGCARLDGKPGTIPAVAIGGTERHRIISRLSSNVRLDAVIQSQGMIEERQGLNVVAALAGFAPPKILVTAHYDCFWNGVMAMDNCAGVAAVLALSQVFTPGMLRGTEFVLFGAEELGCWGASGYVRQRSSSLGGLICDLNLDTFGSNRSGIEVGCTSDLEALCRSVANLAGVMVDVWSIPPRPASDHHRFVEKGYPAVWIANGGTDTRYHTPLDVPSEMSEENLETVCRLAYNLAVKLLDA